DYGLGDLGLEKLRASRPFRVNNHLGIRDVGNSVERRRSNRVDAGDDGRYEQQTDDQPRADNPLDQGGDHGVSDAPLSLLSASTKKLPMETTWSPSARPSSTCVYSSPSMPVWIVRAEYSP